MKFSIHEIKSSEIEDFEKIAEKYNSSDGYKWLSSSEIPSAIPKSLREKIPRAVLMWKRTNSSAAYIVINGIRYDEKDKSLDQEPFGIVVNSSGINPSGIFIHHGDWNNRTMPLTPEIEQSLKSTTFGKYLPFDEIPQNSSGSLSELQNTSFEGAFNRTIDQLISINKKST